MSEASISFSMRAKQQTWGGLWDWQRSGVEWSGVARSSISWEMCSLRGENRWLAISCCEVKMSAINYQLMCFLWIQCLNHIFTYRYNEFKELGCGCVNENVLNWHCMYALGIWGHLTICTEECPNVTNMLIRFVSGAESSTKFLHFTL